MDAKPEERHNSKRPSNSSGFSLMEVLLAISIVLVALTGIMSLLSSINASASTSSSKLIAANLAQEGIEVVKSIRDLNFGVNGWYDWYGSIIGASQYLLQYNDTAFRAWQDTPLKYDAATGLYGYDAGTATPFAFKRTIILTKIDDNEIKVEAVVSWTEHNRSQTLTVEDRLWNWR